MKTKPVAHKEQNTFRFKTFSQQLAEINIGVIHEIGKRAEEPEDADTFFYEALLKWNELNCTEAYDTFKRSLPKDIQTLPQLILNENEIISCLKTHLSIPGSLCYHALLELVVGLARDLQSDFYQYFPEFFEIFTKLLLTKDVELLQQVFKTISYIFKFLWRGIIKDVKGIYSLYSPLLGDQHPEYISNYAAESIAFLLRKVPDKDQLLNLIFSSLADNSGLAKGIGQLLFEVIRGVQQNFHSSAEKMLYLIFSKLGNGLVKHDILLPFDAIVGCQSQMIDAMLNHTSRDLSGVVWDTFTKIVLELIGNYKVELSTVNIEVVPHLERVLKLLSQAIAFKKSTLLICTKGFLQMLILAINFIGASDEYGLHLTQCVASLLLSSHLHFDIGTINSLLLPVYSSCFSFEVKFSFTKQLFAFGMFEKDVMPPFLAFCHDVLLGEDDSVGDDVLVSLASMLLKFHPLPIDADKFDDWRQLKLDFNPPKRGSTPKKRKVNEPILKCLQKAIKLQDSSDFQNQVPKIWAAVICFPHIDGIYRTVIPAHFMDLYRRLLAYCTKESVDEDLDFLLSQVVETMLLTMNTQEIKELVIFDEIQKLLIKQRDNEHYLRIVDFICTYMQKKGNAESCSEFINSVFHSLLPNLASPFHQVRRLTLRILGAKCTVKRSEQLEENVFNICFAAESVELNVQEFRDRVKLLQCLDHSLIKAKVEEELEKVPLYYLIGTLYVNFQPLWEPVIKLIETYARGMDKKTFWDVYGYHLRQAGCLAEKALKEKKNKELKSDDTTSVLAASVSELSSLFGIQKLQSKNATERVDYANHREMLWKAMSLFPDIAETRNRELSPLFLQFLEREYYQIEMEEALTYDVSKSVTPESETTDKNESKTDSDICNISDSNESEDEVQEVLQPISKKPKKRTSDGTGKALCTHLSLFAKFHNPRFIFREPELNKLYMHLLMHPKTEFQRLALDCIMTYHHKYLMPYRENLYRLLDDKTFNSEVVLFSIDSENSVVIEEHRRDMMPVLMRILFGKMQNRYGAKAKGNDFFLLRRKTILHFLANCQEEELKVFLDLVFLPLQQFTDGEVLSLMESSSSNQKFLEIIPPRRQIGILQLVGIIFEKLTHRITSHLPWLFKILLNVTARITNLLENREQINPLFLNVLKDVRTLALTQIMQFFRCFENYPFSKEEIDALFMAAIWPQLERLPFEGVYSPSVLLKLFHHWSMNPRYFVLLAKHHVDIQQLSPLHKMMELLLSGFIRPTVTTMILEILENLLTLEDYAPSMIVDNNDNSNWAAFNEGPVIEVNNGLAIDRAHYADWIEPPNYGSLIVLPHLVPILTKLKQQIEKLGKGQGSKRTVPERILKVLSRLSEFVTDSAGCTELAKLLIPFLSKRLSRSEDVEVNIYTIVKNLLKLVDDPGQFVKPLSILFATQNNRRSRSALCDVFAVIAEKDATISESSSLVSMLNAWDPRRPEEPDYKTRLAGFQNAIKAIEKKDCQNPMTYLLIIYNCSHCIRNVEDLSLRDNASHCIQKMVATFGALIEDHTDFVNNILSSALLPEIKKGLREQQSEVVRHEFLTILSCCAQECTKCSVLKELHSLKNEEFDLDFFENIKHIQFHRRSRAMTRLISGDVCKQLSSHTLVHYILPLASSYLFKETYVKYNNVVDAAIELTGYICRYLPWNQYEKILMFYIQKLPRSEEFQKTAIRILVAVLDAFHFDLSSSEEVVTLNAPSTFKKLKPQEESTLVEEGEELCDLMDVADQDDNINAAEEANKVALATKIHKSIVNKILPQLHKCLTRKAPKDDGHNLAKRYYPEDDEILRVPVAIAMVKLLQHLPKGTMQRSLPSVFMKICTFLKSRSTDIRRTARQTLLTIMDSLGAAHLPLLIKDMSHILTRGYQVHVMTFTLNAVLHQLKPNLKPGDLDPCLDDLIEICHKELFGIVAEEKEVKQILAKIPEAKSTKAYGTYEILASYISRSNIPNLIFQIKQVLADTTSHTSVRKMKECLAVIVKGLVDNGGLLAKDFLIYSHAALSENLQNLNKACTKVEPKIEHPRRPDSFIVPKEPGRNNAIAPTSQRTNAHILVEFGLQLLYFSLKRSRVTTNNQEALEMLDPFIKLLNECLHSPHVQLITSSLRNLTWLLKCPLPSLAHESKELSSSLFGLLKKYSGMAQGSTGEMIVYCFKAIKVLIKNVKHDSIDDPQLRVLLLYVEKDINDHAKQSSAFILLKAILARKLMVPEIHNLMKNIMEKSIISENESFRIQCRQCTLLYLLDFPLGKKIPEFLEFFVAQLNYKEETGRESALEMLTSVFTAFPEKILSTSAGVLFIPMATALCNDESSKCRQMISISIKILLEKISGGERANLFSVTHTWLQDDKVLHRKLAATLIGLFVEVEKEKFQTRLLSAFPLLNDQLNPAKHENIHDEAVQRKADHLLIQALTTMMKILNHCDVLRKPSWKEHLNQMWEYTEKHLLHPHTWVNLLTCQMYGLLFAAYPENEVVAFAANSRSNSSEYFHQVITKKLESLSKDFLHQLRSCHLLPELEHQVAKNMIYLAKIVNRLPKEHRTHQVPLEARGKTADNESDNEQERSWEITVTWLIKKFRREATHEMVKSPKITFKRSCFFKWIAAVASDIDKEDLKSKLCLILPILLREISDTSITGDESLKSLAQEVLNLLRDLVGIEFFSQEYAVAQSGLNEKRANRKQKSAVLAVTDPQVSARKKIKKHKLHELSTKRKLASRHLGKKPKRPKLKDMAITTST